MHSTAEQDDVRDIKEGQPHEGIGHLKEWLRHQRGENEWEFELYFNSSSGISEPSNSQIREDQRAIRQAALNLAA